MASRHTTDIEVAEPITTTIVTNVADREGVKPTELPPLYDVVDPDTLNAVFTSSKPGITRTGVEISFTFCGYEILVHGDGEIDIQANAEK